MPADIALIVACAANRVIGKDGKIPWSLPDDLQHFRSLTLGHPVIMGRKTWESLPRKPLHGRLNIVVSTTMPPTRITAAIEYYFDRPVVVDSLTAALQLAETFIGLREPDVVKEPKIFVIGGEALYREALSYAKILHLTEIHREVAGDAYFPRVNWGEWFLFQECHRSHTDAAALTTAYTLATYYRKLPL